MEITNEIKIIIKYLHNSTIYEINDNITIQELKSKIQEKEGISIEKQNLYFNDKLLENDKTLIDYNIKENSIINLNLIVKRITVYAKANLGKKISLDVKNIEKIENIKKAIQIHEKIPQDLQVLKFNNIILENLKTLEDYKIENNSILDLSLINKYEIISIGVELESGKKYGINVVNHLYLVKTIKIKLHKIAHIPVSEQKLYFNDIFLEDNKMIDYYKIEHNSILKLYTSNITITIERPLYKTTETYQVKPYETIKDLKIKIEQKQNINILNQKLKLLTVELENGNKSLSYYSIQDKSKISLYYKSKGGMDIFLRNGYHNMILDVNLDDKIEDIKEILLEKNNYVRQNYLYYGGKVLSHGRTIRDYNIQKNSTIFIY